MNSLLFSTRKLLLILFVLFTTISFSQEDSKAAPIPFGVVDESPYLSDCKIKSIEDKRKCFQEFLNNHIKKYFNYPTYAKENNTQGKVVIKFVIDETGIVYIESVIGEKEGLEELEKECLNIINKLDTKFIPGIHKGKNVAISYDLPITFKLESSTSKKNNK